MNKSEDRQPMSAEERAALQIAFWHKDVPESALFQPLTVSAVTGHEESMLAQLRTRGNGPRFRKAALHIYYAKGDVIAWLNEQSVIANNTGEAQQLHRERKQLLAVAA